MNWAQLIIEIGSELWRERKRKKAADRAAREWAEKPAAIRACRRCNEIAFTPGQVACTKCGSVL